MRPFLSLIRLPNLLIIAYTQYLMRYAVMQPIVRLYGFELQLSGFTFFCLVLATVCIAAAGYAINDYFDVKTDHINRPEEVVVGKAISRRRTMAAHLILSAVGIILGGYVTWAAGVPILVLVYILVTGILWLYSTTYKRQFLIGNLIVSLFTAMVPLMVLIDIPLLNRTYHDELLAMKTNLNLVIVWISCFSLFAFLTTLSREIIKDAEDFEGDIAYGRNTLPIVLGNNSTKWVIIGINIVTLVLLGLIFWKHLKFTFEGGFNFLTFFYLLELVVLPMLWLSWLVFRASSSQEYKKAGNWMKLVMLAGISFAFIVWYMFK